MSEQRRGKTVTKFGAYQSPSMSGSFAHLNLGSLVVSSLTAYNQVIKNVTTVDELQSIQSISANSISSVTVSAISMSAGSLTLPLSGVLVSDGLSISALAWTSQNDFLRGDGVFAPGGSSGSTGNYDTQINSLSSSVTSLQTATGDLNNSKVPYLGATANVNLGSYGITASRFYASNTTPLAINELTSKTYVDSLTSTPVVNSSTKGFTWFAV